MNEMKLKKKDAWSVFEGKKVFLIIDTSSGERKYSGIVEEVTYLGKTIDSTENYLLLLNSSIGMKVGFSTSQIKLIQEEK